MTFDMPVPGIQMGLFLLPSCLKSFPDFHGLDFREDIVQELLGLEIQRPLCSPKAERCENPTHDFRWYERVYDSITRE